MKFWMTLGALLAMACTQGQAQIDVTQEQAAVFAGQSPLANGAPGATNATQGDVLLDMHTQLASLGDMGALTLRISKNALAGDALSFIQHLSISMATQDGQLPERLLSDVDVPLGSTDLDLPLKLESVDVLRYLTEGPVRLHVTVRGALPADSFTLAYTFVGHIEIAVNGPPKL